MANDARSRLKDKDDENRNSKRNAGKNFSSSVAETSPASGLRRSGREISLNKNGSPGPSSTRKSDRLEKQTPTTPVQRKGEKQTTSSPLRRSEQTPIPAQRKAEKQSTPSPLRRSERGKKQSSSGSSESKKSNKSLSSVVKNKLKREQSIKELTLETKEASKSETRLEKRSWDARDYRALFRQKQKEVNVEGDGKVPNMKNKISQECSINEKDGVSENEDCRNELVQQEADEMREAEAVRGSERTLEELSCGASKPVNVGVENNIGTELLPSSQNYKPVEEYNEFKDGRIDDLKVGDCVMFSHETMSREQGDATEMAKKTLQPEVVNPVLEKGISDVCLGSDLEGIPVKRKRNIVDLDSDSSPHENNFAESSAASFRRQRANNNLHNAKLNQDVCSASLHKDRGETGGRVTAGPAEPILNSKHTSSPVETQLHGNQNTCTICKLGGVLLCCEGRGCKRSYHLSCLDPPLRDVPLGDWYCLACARKKIKSGVHSVSGGVESIWDVKEVEGSNENGSQSKQYLVKYKGLAHVHNRWLPESQLLIDAPSLLVKFNRKNQAIKWRPEWTEPHRLLQKRSSESLKQLDEVHGVCADNASSCCNEWLVKWHGLGYAHATWELEDSSFMELPKIQSLMREYENRHEKAKRRHCLSGKDKKLDMEKALSARGSTGIDKNHLEFINNLLEYWKKGQNVVLIDDQERIMKVITFILSLSSCVSQPFLVVTTSAALHLWDEEFFRLTPSLDAVFYCENKDVRRSIRAVEFYGGEHIMFDVLVTTLEVIAEDLNMLGLIKWEAIIVDEYQRCKIYPHFEHIKGLSTDMRLVLINGQLKDAYVEHLLSLLDCQSDVKGSEGSLMKSSDKINYMKERLSKYVIDGSKSAYSRFVEYWVPAQISNVQLKQYCGTLLSNSLLLRSSPKHALVGAFSDVLISTRKCCDHPYIIDPPKEGSLPKDAKLILDIGIRASGKLQLLEAMLSEIKDRNLRVIVLFQSSGPRKDMIGDILDDFVRQRFGQDSYERIDGFVNPKRKQAALNNFNNQKRRFVFLLETCACSPSVKLSLVDTVIIFGSDWCPANDLRNLQKITLDSQFERLKIFRVYSSFTVEENVLILAKQGKTLDSNLLTVNRAASQSLLMWGSSYLFSKLDKFHSSCTPEGSGSSSFDQFLVKDVIQDFSTILSQNAKDSNLSNSSIILKAKHNQGMYFSDSPLPGEQNIKLIDEELPHIFWTKLFDGRQRDQRFLLGLSPRNRKRSQPSEDSLKKPEGKGEDVLKKRKKLANNDNENIAAGDNEGVFGGPSHNANQLMSGSAHPSFANHSSSPLNLTNISEEPAISTAKSCDGVNLQDSQRNLHLLLKPEIEKLCDILHLPENVKATVQSLLDYVIKNHHVSREPETILQAFQISLCWTGASLLKHKLDHKESLALAKQHLSFSCKKEEADYVHSVLRCLKKVFEYHTKNFKPTCLSGVSKSPTKFVIREHLGEKSDQALLKLKLAMQDYSRSIKDITKKCDKQMRKLLQKQQEEIAEFNKMYKEEKEKLETKQKTEAAVIRLHSNSAMRIDKLKLLDIEYKKKLEALEQQMEVRRKNLEEMHVGAKNKQEKKKSSWLEAVEAWAKAELLTQENAAFSNSHLNGCNPEEDKSMQDREVPPDIPGTVSTNEDTDLHPIVLSANNQISDMVKSHMLDGEALPRVSADANPVASAKNIQGFESSPHEEMDVGNDIHVVPSNNAASIDQQDVVCIVNEDSSTEQQNGIIPSRVRETSSNTVSSNVGRQQDGVLVGKTTSNDFSNKTSEHGQHDGEAASGVPVCSTEVGGSGETTKQPDGMNQTAETVHTQDYRLLGETAEINEQEAELPSELTETAATVEGDHCDREIGASAVTSNASIGVVQQDRVQVPTVEDNHTQEPSLVDALVQSQTDDVAASQENHDLPVLDNVLQIDNSGSSSVHSRGLPTVSEIAHQPNHEENVVGCSNQAVSQPVTHAVQHLLAETPLGGLGTHVSDSRTLPVPLGINNRTMQTIPPVLVPPLPLYQDPLQTELERMHKETDEFVIDHENMKLRLKSDCEKEIEEVVAQIRRKYELKIQEMESEFLTKKTEMETNAKRVLMNKILAEAFRSKCMDIKSPNPPGMQQELPSSFMHQLLQLSSQDSPSAAQNTVEVSGLSSSCPPAVGPQLAVPSTRGAALHLGNITRPPHISSISPVTGNLQVGSDIRAPPPHMLPVRASSSVNRTSISSSLPAGVPVQQMASNPVTTPSTLFQLPIRPESSQQQSHLHNSTNRAEASRVLPPLGGSSISAIKLLMEVDDPVNTNSPGSSQPISGLGPNTDSVVPPGHRSPQDTSTQAVCPNEIVCLSDDD